MKNGTGSFGRIVAVVVVAAVICLAQFGCASAPEGERQNAENAAAIRAVLDAQTAAWNRGDIEGYMDGYERSDQTVFVSGDNITHGWQTVLDHYKKSYDTREKMGTLAFGRLRARRQRDGDGQQRRDAGDR